MNISSIYYLNEIPIILKQHIQSDWITNEPRKPWGYVLRTLSAHGYSKLWQTSLSMNKPTTWCKSGGVSLVLLTDGRTDGWTDGVKPIYPQQLCCAGGTTMLLGSYLTYWIMWWWCRIRIHAQIHLRYGISPSLVNANAPHGPLSLRRWPSMFTDGWPQEKALWKTIASTKPSAVM